MCRKTVVDRDYHAALHTVRQRVHKSKFLLGILRTDGALGWVRNASPVGGRWVILRRRGGLAMGPVDHCSAIRRFQKLRLLSYRSRRTGVSGTSLPIIGRQRRAAVSPSHSIWYVAPMVLNASWMVARCCACKVADSSMMVAHGDAAIRPNGAIYRRLVSPCRRRIENARWFIFQQLSVLPAPARTVLRRTAA